MSGKVFISGSISIKKLPGNVKDSIRKIKDSNLEILVGDADGIDTLIQNFCRQINHDSVTVYSIYSIPRFKIDGFNSKYIKVESDIKKERERQGIKDAEMTKDSDYSLVVWDGKSKGSYSNILRALSQNKKVKVYLSTENDFLEQNKITSNEITFIYRQNNGYAASEVVEYLINEGEESFKNTRAFNKWLLENKVIKKEDGIYKPMQEYEELFYIKKYRGKAKGVKFKEEFINWIEKKIKEIKPLVQQTLL